MEGAADRIGAMARGVIVNSVQTAAGRILFARLDAPAPGSTESMAQAATSQPRVPPRTDRDRTSPSARNPRRT